MEYTISFLLDFLEELEAYDRACREIDKDAQARLDKARADAALRVSEEKARLSRLIDRHTGEREKAFQNYRDLVSREEEGLSERRERLSGRIGRCRTALAGLDVRLKNMESRKQYSELAESVPAGPAIRPDEFWEKPETLDGLIRQMEGASSAAGAKKAASALAAYVKGVRSGLQEELNRLEEEFFSESARVEARRAEGQQVYLSRCGGLEEMWRQEQQEGWAAVERVSREAEAQHREDISRIEAGRARQLAEQAEKFHEKFPPEQLEQEFLRIWAAEPSLEDYHCAAENPSSLRLGDLSYPVDGLELGERGRALLRQEYGFLTRRRGTACDETVTAPCCAAFDRRFNHLFDMDPAGRELFAGRACSLAMRLFMMLPPNKVNFTFFDPITLGETFAVFTRLVEPNDRTSRVINGKIWTTAEDIREKLRITTDHIANVTQRCLQGQYENIQAYNAAAGQNAEPYQVLMAMDFPAGFDADSLRLLEQIIATGPKCGVYTILLRSAEQYAKLDGKLLPLVENIEHSVLGLTRDEDGRLVFSSVTYRGRNVAFDIPEPLNQEELARVIPVLKDGIRGAERIVIGFDKILPPRDAWFQGDSAGELSIPIGVHGANNLQNLTFGVGGSHHALVVGQIGSGKSSLLHTVIMSALVKYPADQLQLFLVDFKRGVEFKIYANYALENFRVIAVESEREFGCSVLEYLDREQSRRADKFKRLNVDNVEDYRAKSGEALPRILLIVDEFHVLFSKEAGDLTGRTASSYLEQLIRQGRAFGIHVILASQSVANIGGINPAVWGQVGVRIALKCPRADARFVLGPDNDGVDLLSAENPGQAVYNSECGSVVANSIFRVAYLDQDEQQKYLRYIAENEPKFRYPETRVMLSNVEDNIYHPFQKFHDGAPVDFRENALLVGEPLKLTGGMRMVFQHRASSNLLVIGNDGQKARTLFTFAALSLALHQRAAAGGRPGRPGLYLFDYAPSDDLYEADLLAELARRLPDYIRYIPHEEAGSAMEELYLDFTRREKGEAEKTDAYLMVYGLQRARDLRSNNIYQNKAAVDDFDEFGGPAQKLTVKPYEMFLNLLQRGAAVGINALIWEDNFKVFMAHYANMLSSFDMRIAFTMPDEDSIAFIEEAGGSRIGENSAIYSYNGNQKFRPYKRPDPKWLEEICARLESGR